MDNRIKEAFGSIHAEEQLKETAKDFLMKELYSKKNRKMNYQSWYKKKYQIAAIAACFLCVVLGTGGYNLYFTEVSAISIDINPSIELGINQFDKVISVEGYNEDGNELAADLDIRFMNYMEAIDEILENEEVVSYLSEEEQMAITVIAEDEDKNREMLANVNACASTHRNVSCHSGDAKTVNAAHHAGLSFGKYQAFLKLQSLDSSIKIEDVKGLTMREINDWINTLSGNSKNGTAIDESGENGNECHGGYENSQGHHGNGHN